MDFCVFFLSRCFVCFCDYQDPGQTKNLPGKILRLFRSQGRVIPNSAFWCQYLFLKLFLYKGIWPPNTAFARLRRGRHENTRKFHLGACYVRLAFLSSVSCALELIAVCVDGTVPVASAAWHGLVSARGSAH